MLNLIKILPQHILNIPFTLKKNKMKNILFITVTLLTIVSSCRVVKINIPTNTSGVNEAIPQSVNHFEWIDKQIRNTNKDDSFINPKQCVVTDYKKGTYVFKNSSFKDTKALTMMNSLWTGRLFLTNGINIIEGKDKSALLTYDSNTKQWWLTYISKKEIKKLAIDYPVRVLTPTNMRYRDKFLY